MVVWFSSGGQSLLAWIGPVLRFSIPVILAVGLLSLVISPWARSQSEIIREQFKQRDEVNAIAPGRFIESMGGKRVFFIESQGEHANEVGRIFMAEGGKGRESVVTAESGRIELNEEGDRYVVLHNGRRIETQNDSSQTRIVEFDSYGVRLDIKIDQPLKASKTASQPLPLLLANPSPENQAQLLWRFTWPFAAFNLALLAVPLSCTSPRAGRSLNLHFCCVSFLFFIEWHFHLRNVGRAGTAFAVGRFCRCLTEQFLHHRGSIHSTRLYDAVAAELVLALVSARASEVAPS